MLCVACGEAITHTSFKHLFNHWEITVAVKAAKFGYETFIPSQTSTSVSKKGERDNQREVNRTKRSGQEVFLTTERRVSSWRLVLCETPLPGICYRACQQSLQPAGSVEGRVTPNILTNLPQRAKNCPQGNKEDEDARTERKISWRRMCRLIFSLSNYISTRIWQLGQHCKCTGGQKYWPFRK